MQHFLAFYRMAHEAIVSRRHRNDRTLPMTTAAIWVVNQLDQRAPHAGAIPHALRPAHLDAGYDLQDEVSALMTAAGHGPAIGWKGVCATTPAMQQLLCVRRRRPS
jgi:hypothetical protein